MAKYLYILATILLLTYVQLMLKFRANAIVGRQGTGGDPIHYIIGMLLDPLVISVLAAGFLSFLTWLMAIRLADIGNAYPFVSLTFVIVPIGASLILKEQITPLQILAGAIIVAGVGLHAVAR